MPNIATAAFSGDTIIRPAPTTCITAFSPDRTAKAIDPLLRLSASTR
jgi:hypothetical protein